MAYKKLSKYVLLDFLMIGHESTLKNNFVWHSEIMCIFYVNVGKTKTKNFTFLINIVYYFLEFFKKLFLNAGLLVRPSWKSVCPGSVSLYTVGYNSI